MNENSVSARKHPVHMPFMERHNQPVIIFVTICSHQRRPVLACHQVHDALIRVWSESRQYLVGCYIIMPDHIHLFCSPAVHEAEGIASWGRYWKRAVSRQLNDLNPLWQRDCWDTQLRGVSHYREKWDYVRDNPVRKEFVADSDDWKYQGCLNELRW
ncbi:MAG: hypothetical protein PF904_08305 [Kiritimatiellae bacterium]|nr:hypothetical protein [Kiritimatiellia bacterium]